jgi:hypothetical protein
MLWRNQRLLRHRLLPSAAAWSVRSPVQSAESRLLRDQLRSRLCHSRLCTRVVLWRDVELRSGLLRDQLLREASSWSVPSS